MIPRSVTAWAALVHDRYLGETVEFLRDNPYGLELEDLIEKTVNEISYSGSFRHLAAGDLRSEPGRLWTTDADLISLEQAQAPHEAEMLLPVHDHGTANALALWFSAELAPGISLSVGPGDPPTHWGMTTAPLRSPVDAHARHGRPRQGQDRPGPARRDVDELGHRAAGRRLGGARRAGDLGGDRRLRLGRSRGAPQSPKVRETTQEPFQAGSLDDRIGERDGVAQEEDAGMGREAVAGVVAEIESSITTSPVRSLLTKKMALPPSWLERLCTILVPSTRSVISLPSL